MADPEVEVTNGKEPVLDRHVTVRILPDGSFQLKANAVGPTDLFAAAKLIELHGESMYAQVMMELAQRAAASQRLVTPGRQGRQQ